MTKMKDQDPGEVECGVVEYLGVFVQLRWENSESTDTATTSHLAAWKYVRETVIL